jgi:hypothetical protein
MDKLMQDTYLTQNFRLHPLKEVKPVMLIFSMKYHQLPRLRNKHVYCMAHYSMLIKVIYNAGSSWKTETNKTVSEHGIN